MPLYRQAFSCNLENTTKKHENYVKTRAIKNSNPDIGVW